MNIKLQNEIHFLQKLKTKIQEKHQLIKKEFKKNKSPEQIKQSKFLKEYEQLLEKYNKNIGKYN